MHLSRPIPFRLAVTLTLCAGFFFAAVAQAQSIGAFVPFGQFLNVSTRAYAGIGDDVLIGGFTITGSEPKNILVRALGPSLNEAGVSGAIANPKLELHDAGGALIASNDNWKSDAESAIRDSGLAPTNDAEAALEKTLSPGAYTAIVSGAAEEKGIVLLEAYDLTGGSQSRITNVSTRGVVGTGDNVLVGGCIIGGGGTGVNMIMVRGIGPTLRDAGVETALGNPVLELHDGNGRVVDSNDDWKDSRPSAIEQTGIAPADERECAIIAAVPAGNYTATVRGKNGGRGNALVEFYSLR